MATEVYPALPPDFAARHFMIRCPGCDQRYFIHGLQIQSQQAMACNGCNSTFRLEVSGRDVRPVLIYGPTGSPIGPAETPTRS
jgi:ribosomal protein S27E